MNISPERYSRDVLASLSESERKERLRELEALINPAFQSQSTLAAFQESLYAFINQLEAIGHFLGRWEYDSEIEYWGGKSYLDPTMEDELLLRSEFGQGVRLAWNEYDELNGSTSN